MFFSKRAFNALSSCSRCSGDKFFLLLFTVCGVVAFISQSPAATRKAVNPGAEGRIHFRSVAYWREYPTIVDDAWSSDPGRTDNEFTRSYNARCSLVRIPEPTTALCQSTG